MKLENIVIYCGSHFGAELSYASFAGELAEAIAKSGRTITYGGGTVGLMGIVADAAMAADRKSTRLNSSHRSQSRMPSSA